MYTDNLTALPFFYKSDAEIIEIFKENDEDEAMTIDLFDVNYTIRIPKRYKDVFIDGDLLVITKQPTNIGHKFVVEELERDGVKLSMYEYNQ